MRLIMTAAPEGRGDDIARTAFSVAFSKAFLEETNRNIKLKGAKKSKR